MDEMQIRETMRAAGCSDTEIIEVLRERGDPDRLLRQLRKCRCRRMEELHESQRHVDLLDFLIRQTQKTTQSSV